VRVAFATCSAFPPGAPDDQAPARLLGAEFVCWDDPAVDWEAHDRVVLRSTWDYTRRADAFLDWCAAVGPGRLRNPPGLVAFAADKRYLAALTAPAVETVFISPGAAAPPLRGEVVVKPHVSAGARDTGRFSPVAHDQARALIARIGAGGRTALVQPYLPAVDAEGETAIVYLGGRMSHVLRKRAVLRGDGIAPVHSGSLRVAAAMLEPDLVTAATASPAHHALAEAVHAEIADRFGTPVYARIDLVTGPSGDPLLLELEVIEPSLYLSTAPGAAQRFADAVAAS
jgi:hypothetical protein